MANLGIVGWDMGAKERKRSSQTGIFCRLRNLTASSGSFPGLLGRLGSLPIIKKGLGF